MSLDTTSVDGAAPISDFSAFQEINFLQEDGEKIPEADTNNSPNIQKDVLQRLHAETVFQTNLRDVLNKSDQEFVRHVSSEEYVNTVLSYQYGNVTYPIRIIHNPNKDSLWGGDLAKPITMSLIVASNVPIELQRRLEDLLFQLGISFEANEIELRGNCALSVEQLGEIYPIYVAQEVDDPKSNALVQDILSSTTFRNEVLYYSDGAKIYRVRILYNPEAHTFEASKTKRLEPGTPKRHFSITWNRKYGIIADPVAPQEIISHLTKLAGLSWWEWLFNFGVHNGTDVEYKVHSHNYVTTYFLGSWFDFTGHLKLKT